MTIYIFFGLWIALWIITGLQCKKKQVAQPFAWGFMISMFLMIPIAYLTGMYDDKKPMAEPQPVAQVQPISQPSSQKKYVINAEALAHAQLMLVEIDTDYQRIEAAYKTGDYLKVRDLRNELLPKINKAFEGYEVDPRTNYLTNPYTMCDYSYKELPYISYFYIDKLMNKDNLQDKNIKEHKKLFKEYYAKCKESVIATNQ